MFSFFEANHGDPRAQAYRAYLVLKMESNSENKFGSCLLREEDLQEDLSRVCEFRSLVKNRLILSAQAYLHTHKKVSNLVFWFWYFTRIDF